MGWTKDQLIAEAYAELGLASYEFDITPEEKQTALRRLDTMMATWEAKGIRVGYLIPASPDASSLDTDSGLPDAAVETVYLNLALRLAPGKGKQVSVQSARSARDGYDALLFNAARPLQQQLPATMPRGAGNKPWRSGGGQPFMPTPSTDPLQVEPGGDLDILE